MLGIILLVVVLVSMISLVGVLTLSLKKNLLERLMFVLISFAVGSMFAASFLDLIPEALESASSEVVFAAVLLGILISFTIERFIYHYHCHVGHSCDHPHRPKPFAYLNLIGDGVHNFLDGLVISASFLLGYDVGIATSIAVIAHEVPQEIGDFAVLLKGGFSRKRALFYNFMTALTAILGALIGYYFGSRIEGFTPILAAIAAGNFIYISAADLLPELNHEDKPGRSALQLVMIIMGILLMWAVKLSFE